MVQTVDIVKSLITQKLKLFLEVEADGVASGANWVVQVCNTLWLRTGKTFDFDGHSAKVISMDFNASLTLFFEDGHIPLKGKYSVINPAFRHGTFKAIQGELKQIAETDMKYPLIYLYEEIDENIAMEELEAIQRESPLRFYFLDNTNTKDWKTEEHYRNIIDPMSNMVEAVKQLLKDEPSIADFNSPAGYKNKVRFGVFEEKGNRANLLVDNLTGIEFKPIVRFYKSCEELCNFQE